MNKTESKIETNNIIAQIMRIPQPQRVQFRLIQLVSNTKMKLFGAKIVRDLLNNYNLLWKACLVGTSEECSIFMLKDLPNQFERSIDTLYIIPTKNKKEILEKLEKLAKSWGVNEIKWIPKEKVKILARVDYPILKLRWAIPLIPKALRTKSKGFGSKSKNGENLS